MAQEQIMNAGWHRGGFSVPQRNNALPLWPDALADAYLRLVHFEWLGGGRLLRFEQQPMVQREAGMPNLGGTYEHCILPFDPDDAAPVVRAQLALAISNGPAPLEPNGFNITVHSGSFSDDSLHWVELHNPYTFERVRLGVSEFTTLVDRIHAQAANEIQVAMSEVFPKLDGASEHLKLLYQRISNFDQGYLVSQSLLLASLFSNHKVSLSTIMKVLLWLPTFAATYRCMSDLPDDGSAEQIPVKKLLLLYGQD